VPGEKGHLDGGLVKRRKEYYMGEGGGFPQTPHLFVVFHLRLIFEPNKGLGSA